MKKKSKDEKLEVFLEWNMLFLNENGEVDKTNKLRALTRIKLVQMGPYDLEEKLRRRDEEMKIQLEEWAERREIQSSGHEEEYDSDEDEDE